jgi:hypothetical protein
MLPFNLTGARDVKPFLGAGLRFHFWHLSVFRIVLILAFLLHQNERENEFIF